MEYIIPILTLLLGWYLREIESFFNRNREKGQVINQALFNLLSIYDSLSVYKRTTTSFKEIHKDDKTCIMDVSIELIQKFISLDFEQKFNDAITKLSSFDPLLSTNLGGYSSTIQTLKEVSSIYHPDSSSSNLDDTFLDMIDALVDTAIGGLKISIVALSKRYSFGTRRRIYGYIKERELNSKSKEVILKLRDSIIKEISKKSH